ncbi:terminase [Burkholderia sp. JPY481]
MAGRPSAYKPEFAELARNYCLLGATDVDLAGFFHVTDRTIRQWKKQQPDFLAAMESGKTMADAMVARSLYNKATNNGTMQDADTTACIFWLKNRQKHAWRDSHAIDHSGKVAVDPITLLLSQVEGSQLKPKKTGDDPEAVPA